MSTAIATNYSAMTSAEMITTTLNLFCLGSITEIRVLDARGRKKRTDSGYFTDFRIAVGASQQYVRDNLTRGVYFVLNPFSPELLARAANRFEEFAATTTADAAITARRWLYVDCDPVRPSGISSTDEQVQAALQRAGDVADWMREHGLCEPITAMSGNGAHLHFPISLPNDPESLAVASGVLRTLDAEFSDSQIKIDTSVCNAARICRLYGTIARKGDSTTDRPHRMARLINVPDYIEHRTGDVCSVEALQAVAAMSQPKKPGSKPAAGATGSAYPDRRLLPELYLRDAGLSFKIETKGEFTHYVFKECPFNPEHKSPDSYFFQGTRGGFGFKCSHDSCAKNDGDAFKKQIGEPKPEHYDPPKTSPVAPAVNRLTAGTTVLCGDRGNRGDVVSDDGGPNVVIHFESTDGKKATKPIARTDLKLLDGTSVVPRSIEFHPFSAWDILGTEEALDEEIVEGIVRRGEVVNIIASTKVGKSWLALGLAYSVATGRMWLGRQTHRGNVLMIDNELRPKTLRKRMKLVAKEMGLAENNDHCRLDVVSLRGQFAGIEEVEAALRRYKPGELSLVILDAKYRFFGELDENKNSDQTRFHNLVDRIANTLDCVVILIHHSSKGDQGGKSTSDVGSGGGAQARAVDTHLIIRPHSEPNFAVLDAVCRSFPPVESETIEWCFPLWRRASEVLQVPRTVDSLILSLLKGSQNVREAIVCVKAEGSSAVYS